MITHTATSTTCKPPRRRFAQTMLIGVGAAAAIIAASAVPAVASTAHHPAGTTVNASASTAAGPAAYSGYHDAPISLPSTLNTIASLPIPVAGNYLVFAKLTLWNGQNVDDTLTCKLIAGPGISTPPPPC
jgi:hypothetical protein